MKEDHFQQALPREIFPEEYILWKLNCGNL